MSSSKAQRQKAAASRLESCKTMDARLRGLRFAPRVMPRELGLVTKRDPDARTDPLLAAVCERYCPTEAQRKAMRKAARDLANDRPDYTTVLKSRLDFDRRQLVLTATTMPTIVLPLLDLEGALEARLNGAGEDLLERFNAASGSLDSQAAEFVCGTEFEKTYSLAYALKVVLDAVPGWTVTLGDHRLPLKPAEDAARVFQKAVVSPSTSPKNSKKRTTSIEDDAGDATPTSLKKKKRTKPTSENKWQKQEPAAAPEKEAAATQKKEKKPTPELLQGVSPQSAMRTKKESLKEKLKRRKQAAA